MSKRTPQKCRCFLQMFSSTHPLRLVTYYTCLDHPMGCPIDYPALLMALHWAPIGSARYIYIYIYPRAPSTSSEGIWTLLTHPKHLLRKYLLGALAIHIHQRCPYVRPKPSRPVSVFAPRTLPLGELAVEDAASGGRPKSVDPENHWMAKRLGGSCPYCQTMCFMSVRPVEL